MEAIDHIARESGQSAVNSDQKKTKMSLESSIDVLPISAAEMDEKSLVERTLKPVIKFNLHLPEEIWEMILNALTEADDRTNCCRAFPLFDRILTKSKPIWMFKLILPFMPWGWASKKSVFTCRRMCKQWRADIDHCILTNPIFWNQTCGHDVNMQNWYHFDTDIELYRFNKTFEGHSGNPFITRSVEIENYLQERDPNYQTPPQVLELLYNYGKHVWTLNFHWEDPVVETFEGLVERFDWVDSYEFFQQAIKNTPNLRKLIMCGNAATPILNSYDGRNKNSFIRFLRENPLPPIPTLDTLEIRNCIDWDFFPDSFIKRLILKYANNLQDISVEEVILGQMLPRQLELPKLAKLQVREVSSDEHLGELLLLTAPLKKLEIVGPHSSNGPVIPTYLSTLLNVFNNFHLLEEVRIERCFVETQDIVSHLINSSVEKLTLDFSGKRAPPYFDFLVIFKALQELTVHLPSPKETYYGRNEAEEDVQFYKMLEPDQFYESNIWRLIPSLKTVRIYCDQGSGWNSSVWGSRKGLEEYQAGRLRN